jgi:hypothetical protein
LEIVRELASQDGCEARSKAIFAFYSPIERVRRSSGYVKGAIQKIQVVENKEIKGG